MKLAKALKLKNKIAGEIAQAQRLMLESNVVEGTNQPPHDIEVLLSAFVDNQEKLANLKGKISVANGPIASKIFILAELKARIACLRALPTKDGTFMSEGGYRTEPRPIQYHAVITAARVENEVKAISAEIEILQDQIDEFNATTEI